MFMFITRVVLGRALAMGRQQTLGLSYISFFVPWRLNRFLSQVFRNATICKADSTTAIEPRRNVGWQEANDGSYHAQIRREPYAYW